MTLERAKSTLRAHIEEAMGLVAIADGPVVDDFVVSCDDLSNDDPNRKRVDLTYSALTKAKASVGAARSIEEELTRAGWEVSRNQGAPETQLMLSASKDGYVLLVSGSRKTPDLVVGGTSPCATVQ